MHPLRTGLPALLALAVCGCMSPEEHVAQADADVYALLSQAAEAVSGTAKTFPIDRPENTLRQRLLEGDGQVTLNLREALDAAAENSRDYQRQKESLYRVGLGLTRAQYDFALRYGASGSADISGVQDTSAQVSFSDALSASVNTEHGGRLVASFASNFFRSVINGDGFTSGSVLGLSFTQPLLAGFGKHIVREGLTQAERDVVYAMRDFESFRRDFTLRVVQDYYGVLNIADDLQNTVNNYESLKKDTERMQALVEAERQRAEDLDQSRQRELSAENSVIATRARLEGALDRFKITLGLPTTARLQLDSSELQRVGKVELVADQLVEDNLVHYAMRHRWDYRTVCDQVADAGRQIRVAEDALRSVLDFSSAIDVPTKGNSKPFTLDWDNVEWSAGFDLDLAIERLPQRNAYRSALIALDAAIRAKEQFEDGLRADIRQTIRDLQNLEKSYRIRETAVRLAERRVARTEAFMQAGGRANTTARDVLEAKDDLLANQLDLSAALVDFAVAKLQLLRDLEALPIEPKGLRYDPRLPMPPEALLTPADQDAAARAAAAQTSEGTDR